MADTVNNVIALLPRTLPGGFRVEYSPEVSELGGLQVIIWKDAARNEGFCFSAPTPFDAYRILTKIAEQSKRRAHG
ncbi:MAG: hypothetical protein Q7J44_03610 [Pseudotabrizicola sp.]|uniref:hypothetical protein n=1 Tax=Pseudotabrizicola sp. TaxID=2939647 RepID=UPI0027166E80|nr:hypothetical protein [Pseudotabrizicola sp.]MDO9637609.1 hypothetical protein [Pseudotabrizicola sp.]